MSSDLLSFRNYILISWNFEFSGKKQAIFFLDVSDYSALISYEQLYP